MQLGLEVEVLEFHDDSHPENGTAVMGLSTGIEIYDLGKNGRDAFARSWATLGGHVWENLLEKGYGRYTDNVR